MTTAPSHHVPFPDPPAGPDEHLVGSDLLARGPGLRRGIGHGLLLVIVALVVTVATAAATVAHVVAPGESLSSIADEHGVTVDEIVDANDLVDPDHIEVGQTLTVPVATTHVVVAGDTLWDLAATHGVSVEAIRAENDLSGDLLVVGSTLVIPAPAPATAPAPAAAGGGLAADSSDPRLLVTPTGVVAAIVGGGPGAWQVRTPCGRDAVADGTAIGGIDVLLDPGHGGAETGAVGANGLVEADLNLTVSLRVAAMLEARGYRVALTRMVDYDLPIATRAELALAARPDLFVSIHHNGGAITPSSEPGTQTYHQHDDPESRRAAGLLYEELFDAALGYPTAWVGNFADGVSARLGSTGDDFYGVLRLTGDVPSVITEFLWLSNGPEAELLARDDVLDAQALAIADGIERWFTTADPGSGYVGTHTDTYDHGGSAPLGCADPALG